MKRLFEKGDPSGIRPEHVEKVENILAVLDRATAPGDLDLPGFRLHALKGDLKVFLGCHGSGELACDFPD